MVTSFATLPLMDASRDTRIHDWIAEQYSFALSEFQDELPWRNDPPSLRESKLLPDDFDIITRLPSSPPPQRDTDSDADTQSARLYDPPLLPSPLPLLHNASLHHSEPKDNTNLEDAFDGLLRQMHSWRFVSPRRSAPAPTLSNRNKVCLRLFDALNSSAHVHHAGASGYAFPTSDTHFGKPLFPAADRSFITLFLHFPCHTHVFFPTSP